MAELISIAQTAQRYGTPATHAIQGWVDAKRDHGKMTFIDLRDGHGDVVQCVGRNLMGDLNLEDVVRLEGKIVLRPAHMKNEKIPTGAVEFVVEAVHVLNRTKPLPIPVQGDGYDTDETKRLRYRYLDLRRSRMAQNLRNRATAIKAIRAIMDSFNFLEVETPILAAPTKEGARDFVVPSRFHQGEFYALPQSPQQYKQLLMVAGVPAYYQIAKCFRDETPRSDRGFEFTQFDMELAFGTEEEIQAVATRVVQEIFWDLSRFSVEESGQPFPVMTYAEAMAKYGTDKPDIRTQQQKDDGKLAFVWITRFPMFKKAKEDVDKLDSKSGYTFMHNPFSAPIDEHKDWLLQGINIDQILAQQYDLVCNGLEIGSGSVRAHSRALLEATYKVMGYSQAETEASVGHMLEAFDFGTPPHGGIALGVDRLVMLGCKEESIKEVIAFPTTTTGRTSVMGAPLPIGPVEKKELGLK
jgi:aspartyl-tRNA synthetase